MRPPLASLLFALVALVFAVAPGSIGAAPHPHADDEVLVRFAPGVSAAAKNTIHGRIGGHRVKGFSVVPDLELVKLPKGVAVKDAIKHYQKHSDVLYAEPNYVVRALLGPPDDPLFSSLWGLNNTTTPSADIDALGAWQLTTGDSAVVVAVIDTGIDYTHPDLAANMFQNTVDCNANQLDSDSDGRGDLCDCNPTDPTNPPPAEVADGCSGPASGLCWGTGTCGGPLTPDKVTLNWVLTPLANNYDILSGDSNGPAPGPASIDRGCPAGAGRHVRHHQADGRDAGDDSGRRSA